ncbi:SgcJ/EcaC family oxidoreductase [Actinoplanes sp. DH11]|uniref:SgcJ/EcaC family oxidoreductase n=1 Tax=Actinoplanes sp. DH11 TaxID=2857011 RepID=UPI001E2D9F5C|nr:SgcJ/EcaC family oxidoreductase [Actinoplanes sp. DH11]
MSRYLNRMISTARRAPRWRAALVSMVAVPSIALGAAAGPAAAEPSASSIQDRDLVALQELRQRQDQAWARGDARAYAALYTSDADVVTFNGDHLSTRAGIEEGMGYYFTTYLRGTRLLQRDQRIRFPEPDLAVIVRTGCVLWPGETACTEEALSVNTNVAVKRHGRWLYTSFQNTRIRPLGPAT